MYAVFIILNDMSKLDDVLKVFYDDGCGATTLDSEGVGRLLLDHNVNIPIFAGLRKLVEGDKPNNKTIISIIQEEKKLREIVDTINDEFISIKGTGIMFVMPIIECYGVRNNEYNNH